jgi:hypothetical protein
MANSLNGMATPGLPYDLDNKLVPVRDKFEDLQGLISNLSEKLGDVTSHLEQEFLSAYRVHQISIQEELKDLKERVAKAEESLVEDGAVARMEEECNWFKSESKRLQSHVSAMTKDKNLMKTRLRELRDQKGYLSDQLKAILKRSRVFSAEIEYTQKIAGGSVDGSSASGASDGLSGRRSGGGLASKQSARSQSTPALATVPAKKLKSSKTAKKLQAAQSQTLLLDMQHKIRHTRQMQENYADRVGQIAETRSECDVLLEDALHMQFDKVVARKTSAVLRGLRNRQDIKDYATDGGKPGVVPPAFSHEIPKVNGLTGLGIDDMTDMDKFQAMVHFLSNPEVFRTVVGNLQVAP